MRAMVKLSELREREDPRDKERGISEMVREMSGKREGVMMGFDDRSGSV